MTVSSNSIKFHVLMLLMWFNLIFLLHTQILKCLLTPNQQLIWGGLMFVNKLTSSWCICVSLMCPFRDNVPFITLCACTRGKIIGFVHLSSSSSSSVSTKIARLQDLGIWASWRCQQTVENGEILASVAFESPSTGHRCCKLRVLLALPTYWPCACILLPMHTN